MKSSQAIDRMRQVIRRQHKALATEDTYVFWLRRYISALHTIPADLPSEQKVERFLTQLALRDQVAASTQNQAFNAVIVFYKEVLGQPLGNINALRAKRPVHARHAPTVADTKLLLQTIRDVGGYPTNLVARLLYGCGLRVSDPLNLRIKDVNLEQFRLCIRGAKGGNDRFAALPATLVAEVNKQIERARAVWQRDHQDGTPVMLPHRLARKYPEYRFAWGWAWLTTKWGQADIIEQHKSLRSHLEWIVVSFSNRNRNRNRNLRPERGEETVSLATLRDCRVSSAELATIENAANREGKPTSVWIRGVLLTAASGAR